MIIRTLLLIATAVLCFSVNEVQAQAEVDIFIHCGSQGIIDKDHTIKLEVTVPKAGGGTEVKTVTMKVPSRSSSDSIAGLLAIRLARCGVQAEAKEAPNKRPWLGKPHQVQRLCIPNGSDVKIKQWRKKEGDGGNGHMDLYINGEKQSDFAASPTDCEVELFAVGSEAIAQGLLITLEHSSGQIFEVDWEAELAGYPTIDDVLVQLGTFLIESGATASISGNTLSFSFAYPDFEVTKVAYALSPTKIQDADATDGPPDADATDEDEVVEYSFEVF